MKWNFDILGPNSDLVGFKDNDIEKFNKNLASSLVREAFQNSLDALDEKSGHNSFTTELYISSLNNDIYRLSRNN